MPYLIFHKLAPGIITITILCTTVHHPGRFSKLSLYLQKGRPQANTPVGLFYCL